MSATGRGRKRRARDWYGTPAWCTRSLIENVDLPGGKWLEPCAGEGAIIKAVNEHRQDIDWSFCEIREECRSLLWKMCRSGELGDRGGRQALRSCGVIGDFLTTNLIEDQHYDLIISNPPFSIAEEIVRRCMEIAPKAMIVMLLRGNFLGSAKRNDWLRAHMPDAYPLGNRPIFGRNDDGTWGSDNCEYSWMVWHGARRRTYGKIMMLPSVDKDIRKRDEGRLEESHGKPRRAAA